VDSIDEHAVESRLYTAGLPDPDLVIRTAASCASRTFLLFQAAYAEFGRPRRTGLILAKSSFRPRSTTTRYVNGATALRESLINPMYVHDASEPLVAPPSGLRSSCRASSASRTYIGLIRDSLEVPKPAELATGFEPGEQEMIVEHSSLRSEYVEHVLDLRWRAAYER